MNIVDAGRRDLLRASGLGLAMGGAPPMAPPVRYIMSCIAASISE